MSGLRGKTILILSPQAWGTMFLSKHHYAIELAKRGNKVYFLNPPDQVKTNRKESTSIHSSKEYSSLFLIDHRLFFPYRIKFRLLPIFQFLIKFHIKSVLKKTEEPIDIVWSFDLGNHYPLSIFGIKSFSAMLPLSKIKFYIKNHFHLLVPDKLPLILSYLRG